MSAPRNEPDQAIALILVGGVIFIILWLVWHFFKQPILEVLRWMRFSELWLINLFANHRYDPCLDWLRKAKFYDQNPSQEMIVLTNQCFTVDYLKTVPAEDSLNYYGLSAVGVATIEQEVTSYFKWPFIAMFAAIGGYVMFLSPRNKFRTRHNLESFIKVQVKMWPVISPIVNFNPIKSSARIPGNPVPDKLPLFAEALSPEEWIAWHRINVTNNIPDREATRRAMLQQLGPRWNGIASQPIYIQALFAAYSLKGVQKREDSDELLGRISLCWSANSGLSVPPKLTSEIKGILNNSEIGGQGTEIASKYAYRTTAILSVLQWARSRGGVLAPAQFLWLRGVDRTLWYALNNLGRRSFHAEGAAAMAHFMAEQNAQKPLPIPRIDTAIVTLNQYLAERGQPIPSREKA